MNKEIFYCNNSENVYHTATEIKKSSRLKKKIKEKINTKFLKNICRAKSGNPMLVTV